MRKAETRSSQARYSRSDHRALLELRQKVISLTSEAMLRDAYYVREQVIRFFSSSLPRKNPEKALGILLNLQRRLQKSAEKKSIRGKKKPRLSYHYELPITRHRQEIIQAIKENKVVIVSGETGCGKSTQLPKMCLEAGQGLAGKIACTQPRRLAAMTIAHRISEELSQSLGQAVGYKIRFEDRTSPDSYIKILTDGMLLAETQADRLLTEYDTIIIDEAHERSLNIDFLIGWCRQLIERRPELKLIITSATLEVEKFAKAFNNSPVFQVSGRLFPVEVIYFEPEPTSQKKEEPDYVDLAVQAVEFIKEEKSPGDILIFMPTEQDILETCQRLKGKNFPGSVILPLFARLPAHQQKQIYQPKEGKIVVATNVAETSLTIPGIRYVVDTGLARISQYQPSSGIHSLPILPISRARAEQRKGRCGRVSQGLCLRLYSEDDFQSRPEHTPPEILRSNLAEVILRLLDLNLGDPLKFPFLDRPTLRGIRDGYRTLVELGAVEKDESGYRLTDLGRKMAHLPLDPRLARMLLEAENRDCLKEVAIIAAALSIPDPRLRPLDRAAEADRAQSVFRHPESDFLTLINLWEAMPTAFQGEVSSQSLRKFSRDYFLSYNRLREWLFVHEQILEILKEQKIKIYPAKPPHETTNHYTAIHQSILSGFISHLAVQKEKKLYQVARGHEASLWPGSALFKKPASWVVAAELVKTNRLYLRTVARVNPAWVEELAPHLCNYSYEDPYWDKDRGEVRAKELVSIFNNLVIISGRNVSFGGQDPEIAHQIFVEEALVKNQVNRELAFLEHNQRLIGRIRLFEEKLRQRNILIPEQHLFDFYSNRLQGVYNLTELDKRIKNAGSDDFLRLEEENLYFTRPPQELLEKFPDSIKVLGHIYQLRYRFSPGEEDDGVTILVPRGLINNIPEDFMTWPVPGLIREKVEACLKALPKEYRKLLQPLSEKAELIARELKPGPRSFFTALTTVLKEKLQVDIPGDIWGKLDLPRYLKMRITVLNETGEEILSSRDLGFLKKMISSRSGQLAQENSPGWKEARARWERQGLTGWKEDLPEIPEEITIDDFLKVYPALTLCGEKFELKLYQTRAEANKAHSEAIEVILARHFQKDLNFILRSYSFSETARPITLFFGGESSLKNSIMARIKEEVFRKNFRSLLELQSFMRESALKQLFEKSHQIFTAVLELLQEYQKTRNLIQEMRKTREKLGVSSSLPDRLKDELEQLVPRDFLEVYPFEFLRRLPRIVQALGLRAERARLSAEKDLAKTAQVEPFLEGYERLKKQADKNPDPRTEELLFKLRWMIEEFKISLFAPEIKTAFPVSAKRLMAKIKEIEAAIEG